MPATINDILTFSFKIKSGTKRRGKELGVTLKDKIKNMDLRMTGVINAVIPEAKQK